jgi:hypothetical protein
MAQDHLRAMVNRKHILIALLVIGLLLFYGASKLLSLRVISDNGYFLLYASGLLFWAIRMRMQTVCLFDKLAGNIAMWLCVFNVYDELFSKHPTSPYKPYIMSIIVVVSSVILYLKACRRTKKSGI